MGKKRHGRVEKSLLKKFLKSKTADDQIKSFDKSVAHKDKTNAVAKAKKAAKVSEVKTRGSK